MRPTVFRDGLFDGQVALVSGGGTGIGRVIATLFARLGARVAICGRREGPLRETAGTIEHALGTETLVRPMSIRERDQVDALVAEVWDRRGRLDHLVNNAGGQFPTPSIDLEDRGWRAVVDTNLNGTWYMMQAAARRWRDEGHPGSIVNIVLNTERGTPQVVHSGAARAGVVCATRTVSTEWAPYGIRANCVSAGAIETEGHGVYPAEAAARFRDSNPMRRMGESLDVAEAVAYLSGPSGSFLTGVVLTVDGGQHQWGDLWPSGMPGHFRLDH